MRSRTLREALDRIDEDVRLSREAAERHAAMFDDTREFIREMTLRMERGTNAMVAEIADLRDIGRSQTEALLQVLDRLPPRAADGSG
ncbi:hypothetical protein [Patulibacter defluvii]|uniref:hypothetical protein n=1 Tax=Patulibacter defluvii TaxID=3095358 RepID=UPI002A7533E0|nr:hypothetical protein [Patulibacter sp. DM4]